MKQLIQKKEYIENGTVSYRTYSLSLNSGDHDNSEEKKGLYKQFLRVLQLYDQFTVIEYSVERVWRTYSGSK